MNDHLLQVTCPQEPSLSTGGDAHLRALVCGVPVDHATVHRWSLKMIPVFASVFRKHKRLVGSSWRMDETYILVSGQWKYLYRAVNVQGQAIDFLMSAKLQHGIF